MVNPISRLMGLLHPHRDGTIVRTAAAPPPRARMIVGSGSAPELCMLASDGDVETIAAMGDVIVQTKLDGIRALYIDGQIVSREGLPLACAAHCQPALRRLEEMFGTPMMFDAEYVAEGGFNATLAEHKRGEGTGVMWLFDAVPMGAWVAGGWNVGTHERVSALKARFLQGFESPFVGLIDHKLDTINGALRFARVLWALGGEGIVAKRADAPYSRARSADWLRLKEVHTMDLPIIDIIARPNGDLHKIIVRGPADIGPAPITLGSGWSAVDGRAIVKATATGCAPPLAEVSFSLTTGTKRSIRGARLHRFRWDKQSPRLWITDEPDNYRKGDR